MGLFDRLQQNTNQQATPQNAGQIASAEEKRQTFTFAELPETLQQMQALPEISLDSPYKTAALAVCAFCVYAVDKESGEQMLNFLRGPKGPLSPYDKQFFKDRLMDQQYVPFSYFEGAKPANDYRPDEPYRITVFADSYSFQNEGYAKLNVTSGGADSPRQIMLRSKGNQWFLWEQFILVGIRKPASKDPWA